MCKEKQIHIRVSQHEKTQMEQNMTRLGFRQLSEYLRFLGLLQPTFCLDETNIDEVKYVGKASIKLEKNKED